MANTQHIKLNNWIQECIALCKPKDVQWVDGSEEQYKQLTQLLVSNGTLTPLNSKLR